MNKKSSLLPVAGRWSLVAGQQDLVYGITPDDML